MRVRKVIHAEELESSILLDERYDEKSIIVKDGALHSELACYLGYNSVLLAEAIRHVQRNKRGQQPSRVHRSLHESRPSGGGGY